ncbi:hypothetical protein GN156_02620 [bacterium LRH843]|nr:hypothetical protein [bacterium LRH843]
MFPYGPPPRHNPNYCQQPKNEQKKKQLSPDNLAVIAALLTNALVVQSVLINRDQTIEVLLSGSLKQKSEIDKLVEQVKNVPVGEFLNSLLNKTNS